MEKDNKIYNIQIRGSGDIYDLKDILQAVEHSMKEGIGINVTITGVTGNTSVDVVVKEQYSQVAIEDKVEDAKGVLKRLKVPEVYLNRICILTFLALCKITPGSKWKDATNEHMGLSNDIMKFVTDNYNMAYKANSRESFRREGINVLLNYGIIDLNPGNPNLGPTSPLTHYAIKENVLQKVKKC